MEMQGMYSAIVFESRHHVQLVLAGLAKRRIISPKVVAG